MIDFSVLIGPGFLNAFWVAVLAAFSQYIALRAGVFSMASAGFMAIGAYCVAILTIKFHFPPALAVLVGIGLATFTGLIVGVLVGKLRGAYQGIGTLAFVLILQHVISLWTDVTGGHFGIAGIPLFSTQPVFVCAVAAVVVLIVVLEVSPIGRRQAGVRIDEIAAASLGVNVALTSVLAITLSASVGGLAGALLAGNQFAIDPAGFSFELVIATLASVIIGGYRSFLGPIIGALITVALPLLFSKYLALSGTIVGILTIAILMLAPGGLATLIPLDSEFFINLRRKRRSPPSQQVASLERQQPHELIVDDICRSYGAVRAVNGVSLSVQSGRIVGLIGPNGAGKTSVINLIAGLTALNSGSVRLDNVSIDKLPAFRVERCGIARTFQACRLFHENTVWSNVLFAATSGRTPEQRRETSDIDCANAALKLAGCDDFADRLAGNLAYAFQRRTEIARALACQPKFLLLDEPAAGMTQSESEDLGRTLKVVAASGVGILVVDHNVPWMLSICDVINVQHLGKLIASGPPDVIRDDPIVIGAYIGSRGGASEAQKQRKVRRALGAKGSMDV